MDAVIVLLNQASQSEFAHTCAIFALAAFVHSKQVRKEIRTQFGELVLVIREDLNATKTVLASLADRVDRLEKTTNNKITKE